MCIIWKLEAQIPLGTQTFLRSACTMQWYWQSNSNVVGPSGPAEVNNYIFYLSLHRLPGLLCVSLELHQLFYPASIWKESQHVLGQERGGRNLHLPLLSSVCHTLCPYFPWSANLWLLATTLKMMSNFCTVVSGCMLTDYEICQHKTQDEIGLPVSWALLLSRLAWYCTVRFWMPL